MLATTVFGTATEAHERHSEKFTPRPSMGSIVCCRNVAISARQTRELRRRIEQPLCVSQKRSVGAEIEDRIDNVLRDKNGKICGQILPPGPRTAEEVANAAEYAPVVEEPRLDPEGLPIERMLVEGRARRARKLVSRI